MSGLLTKEFMYVTKQARLFLVMLVFYGVFFATMSSKRHEPWEWATMTAIILIILTVMLTINTIAYDEQAKWDGFVRSLPLGVNQIVGAKYLFSFIFAAVGALLASAVDLILSGGHEMPQTLALLVAAAVGAPMILCSVLLPLFYKFGLQKARLAIAVVFLLPTILSNLLDKAGFSVSESQTMLLLKLFPVILIVFVFASYLLSCWFYRRNEI